MTITANESQITVSGVDPAISSINIGLADIQALDMSLYYNSLTDISNGTDYTLTLAGVTNNDSVFYDAFAITTVGASFKPDQITVTFRT